MICVLVGIGGLAGILHDRSIGEPWGWILAVVLAVGVIAGGFAAIVGATYVLIWIFRGPAGSFRLARNGDVVIRGHVWGSLSSMLRHLQPPGASGIDESNGYFSLVVNDRGLRFRYNGRNGPEFASAPWEHITGIAPAAITQWDREFTGIAVTTAGTSGPERFEFMCARVGFRVVYGRQSLTELQAVCDRISAMNPAAHGRE